MMTLSKTYPKLASTKKSNFVCGLFAISFILNGYASGITGLSLGSVCFVFLIIYAIVFYKHNLRIWNKRAIVLIGSFIAISFVDFAFRTSNIISARDVLVGFFKYIIWLAFASICASRLFNKRILLKWLIRISIILTAYLIIQNIMYYGFSIYLPNIFNIGPLRPYDEGYADYSHFKSSTMLRPASFLSESSFYGNYVLCTLVMLLDKLNVSYTKKETYLALFFTFGIVLSTSTSAILMLPLVWLIIGRGVFRHNRVTATILILLAALSIRNLVVDFNSFEGSNDSAKHAVFYTFDKLNNMDSSSRFGLSYFFLSLMSPEQKMLGVGIGNETQFLRSLVVQDTYYLNSVSLLIMQVGYIGILLFGIYLFSLLKSAFRYKSYAAITLLIIYIIKGFGSGIYFSTYGVLFMFIISGYIFSKQDYGNLSTK